MSLFVRPVMHDRQHLAMHVEALVRSALMPLASKYASDCQAVCESPASTAPALPTRISFASLSQFNHFIPCPLRYAHGAQRDLASPDVFLAAQRSRPVDSVLSLSCPSARRRIQSGNGCRPRELHKSSLPAVLRIRQAAVCKRRTKPIDRHQPGQLPCWLDDAEPVAAAMRRWEHQIPVGWHNLMLQTLRKFLGAACSDARWAALKRLGFLCHRAELCCFLPAGADPVLIGIARKTEKRSQCICSECGCGQGKCREMGEDNLATLCPRCAAPPLLEHDIWILAQSLGFLRGVNAAVVAHQIPALLRPSFRQAATGHPENNDLAGRGRMSAVRFLAWAADWLAIGKRIFSR